MLRQLKGSITIMLIEHDMEAVFALADRITVLVYGRVIASGDAASDQGRPGCARSLSRREGRPAARFAMADAPLLELSPASKPATA